MESFCLTENEWNGASVELVSIGRLRSGSDRKTIEMMCGVFIASRSRGKHLPSPKRQAKAWEKVQTAAVQLRDRITDIANDDEAVDVWSLLSPDVPSVVEHIISVSEYLARIEGMGPQLPNRADPALDWLQSALIGFFASVGGNVGASTPSSREGQPYGPLVRFLNNTYAPACVAAGLGQPSLNAIREVIRKYQQG